MSHYVFVYGSLKRGLQNHYLISDATFLGDYVTQEDSFVMTGLHNGFPFVYYLPENEHTGKIKGELYSVDDATLEALDCLEGHPFFYRRTPVVLDGFDEEVEMYITVVIEDRTVLPIEDGVYEWIRQ